MAPSYYGENDDDEARTPLVGNANSPTESSRHKRNGVWMNRMIIIFTLVALVVVSLFLEMQQLHLTEQLRQDESKIAQLLSTVQGQAQVIQRFNQSVTNADVLDRLNQLNKSLTRSQKELRKELDHTVDDVNKQLKDTMTTLDETVQTAEQQITSQVETVKKNFEQYVVRTEDQFSMENSFMVYQLAGTFTLLSCLISMWHLTAHLRKMKQPVIQRKILAILWMSPIYAITSWFSLVFPEIEGYLAIVKDAYEAYIIYQFLSFCIAVLGKGDRNVVVDLLARRADHLTPPFRLFFCCKRDPYENDHHLADAILLQCQLFAMQFVFFRPVTTIAKVVLAKYEYYGPWGAESPNDYRAPQFYVTLIQNLSIFTAFTGLLKFYHAVDKDLEWCRPFAKFLCIKGVVFMTFWQGLAITILAEVTDVGGNDADTWALSAQNFLICLEMLLFSIAHFYCFPTEEWDEGYRANFNKAKFGDSIALSDFFADLKLIMKGNKTKKKAKKKPSEPTVPEGDEGGDEEDGIAISPSGSSEKNDEEDDGDGDEEPDQATDDNTSVTSDTSGSLVNALGKPSTSDSPQVTEARNRLLQSGLLDEMLFMGPRASLNGSDSSLPHEEPARLPSSTYYGSTEDHSRSSSMPETLSERTSLLSSSESLRPSIFTTIAALSEQEEKKENEKSNEESS